MNEDRSGVIFIDLETRARVNLPDRGGWAYSACAELAILCGCALDCRGATPTLYAWADAPVHPGWEPTAEVLTDLGYYPEDISTRPASLTEPGELPPWLSDAAGSGATLVAHNAHGFDRLVWDAVGYPEARWLDSAPRARRRGLPGGLDAIAKRLYGLGKDPMGRKLVMTFSVPQKKRGNQFIPIPTGSLTAMTRYCARDVMLLAAIWVDERLGDPHPDDACLEVHTIIDRRGIQADLELADALLALDLANTEQAVADAEMATCGEVTAETLRSTQQLHRWLATYDIVLPDLTAGTVMAALALAEEEFA